jgi:hypothetical protein
MDKIFENGDGLSGSISGDVKPQKIGDVSSWGWIIQGTDRPEEEQSGDGSSLGLIFIKIEVTDSSGMDRQGPVKAYCRQHYGTMI